MIAGCACGAEGQHVVREAVEVEEEYYGRDWLIYCKFMAVTGLFIASLWP